MPTTEHFIDFIGPKKYQRGGPHLGWLSLPKQNGTDES